MNPKGAPMIARHIDAPRRRRAPLREPGTVSPRCIPRIEMINTIVRFAKPRLLLSLLAADLHSIAGWKGPL